jgi:hypothetical protein
VTKAPEDGERLEGRYANFFNVGHNSVEFVLDFGQFYPGSERRMHTRIVTNPKYAKALLDTLLRAVDEYERSFGVID